MLKRFTQRELVSLEAGEQTGEPAFIGIGTPKSGTSWWYQCIQEHPQVVENRLGKKEVSYFQHLGLKRINEDEIREYWNLFAVKKNQICGEWSPGYMFYPLCIDNLSLATRNTKLLIILRNPVSRLLSQYKMLLEQRTGFFNMDDGQDYIFRTYSLLPEAFYSGLYAYYLKRVLDRIDKARIKILIYENCIKEPLRYISDTYRFLDIDDTYQPESAYSHVNKTMSDKADPEYDFDLIREYFQNEIDSLLELYPDLDISTWSDTRISG